MFSRHGTYDGTVLTPKGNCRYVIHAKDHKFPVRSPHDVGLVDMPHLKLRYNIETVRTRKADVILKPTLLLCADAITSLECANLELTPEDQKETHKLQQRIRQRSSRKRVRVTTEDDQTEEETPEKKQQVRSPEEQLQSAIIKRFQSEEARKCKNTITLSNGIYTVLAKKDTSFRKLTRTVLLLDGYTESSYFAPDNLAGDLQHAICPVGIQRIGQKSYKGKTESVFKVLGVDSAKDQALEMGRPIEMHTLVRDKHYIATNWTEKTWYRTARVVFLVHGMSQPILACPELQSVFRENPGKQVEFYVTGTREIRAGSNVKIVAVVRILQII
jgi:hypothetical protein